MRTAHERERAVGIEYCASAADGTGGRLRDRPADFRVRELERFDAEPADADPDAYPHLVVRATLRNWDTNDFAAALADRLGASRERVDWAGTKDKRAVTTQLFTVRDADPADLPELSGAAVEVVGRAGRGLRFGDLAGNAFEVVVRDPERPEQADAVTAELRAFAGQGDGEATDSDEAPDARVGVPNWFGQQRFGSRRPVTHEVGLALARDDPAGAVLAYVGNPDPAEDEAVRDARRYVETTRDWQGALERFPDRLGYERAMLHALVEREHDGRGEVEDDDDGGPDTDGAALNDDGAALNDDGDADLDDEDYRAALAAVPTNLQRLFVHAAQSYAFNRILSERLARGLPFDRPVAGDVVCFADRDAPDGLELPDPDRLQRATADRVETVARHCERGRAFVTAPLVGTETELADGEPGDIERAVLDDLGLAPGDFELPGEFGSTGTRRAVLVRTDLAVGQDPLSFSFSLPKGAYATVLLREYLKADPLAME